MLNTELRRYLLYIVIIISGCSMAYVLVLGQVGENLQSQLHSRPQHSSFMETTSADQYKRNLQIWQSIEAEREIENEIQIENENEIEKEELSSTIAGKDNADSSFFDYKENEKDDIEEEHEELHKQENITEYLRSRENIYEERLQILHRKQSVLKSKE
ncbi:uncharacterized protein LOC111703336 [Eurytemora carolleeae]|uniref:uncharacterized protein LOC111703336 n=1 Tax=Eurytemora carolleeae TaxID=1294199 RepID=UPI000C773279|nr:uncharacterized protein LOC111703336 [Eurytemora carolleeae]|eukprot:XP_023331006.1 uncharacterized protein LOC111703336 [Eurytemora affinis]